jgi:hypothetical protein
VARFRHLSRPGPARISLNGPGRGLRLTGARPARPLRLQPTVVTVCADAEPGPADPPAASESAGGSPGATTRVRPVATSGPAACCEPELRPAVREPGPDGWRGSVAAAAAGPRVCGGRDAACGSSEAGRLPRASGGPEARRPPPPRERGAAAAAILQRLCDAAAGSDVVAMPPARPSGAAHPARRAGPDPTRRPKPRRSPRGPVPGAGPGHRGPALGGDGWPAAAGQGPAAAAVAVAGVPVPATSAGPSGPVFGWMERLARAVRAGDGGAAWTAGNGGDASRAAAEPIPPPAAAAATGGGGNGFVGWRSCPAGPPPLKRPRGLSADPGPAGAARRRYASPTPRAAAAGPGSRISLAPQWRAGSSAAGRTGAAVAGRRTLGSSLEGLFSGGAGAGGVR